MISLSLSLSLSLFLFLLIYLGGWAAAAAAASSALCWNSWVEGAERGRRGTKAQDWDTFWHETIAASFPLRKNIYIYIYIKRRRRKKGRIGKKKKEKRKRKDGKKREKQRDREEENLDFYGLLATFLCVELPVTTMTLCPPTFLYSSTHPPGGWPSNTCFFFPSFFLLFLYIYIYIYLILFVSLVFFVCFLFIPVGRPHLRYGAECTV